MHWRFVDWSKAWSQPPSLVLALGLCFATAINLPILYWWDGYEVNLTQQKILEQQNSQLDRIKLIKELKGYHVPSQSLAVDYDELSQLYPKSFSTSDMYAYVSSQMPPDVSVIAWRWNEADDYYLLTVTLESSFRSLKDFISLALGYIKTSRLESMVVELQEGKLISELELGFYIRKVQHEG